MKNFNWKSYLITFVVVFVVIELLDFLIHGVLMTGTYESMEGSGLFREDMESKMYLIYISNAIFCIFFVYLYHFFVNGYKTGWMAGLYYGLVIAFLMVLTGTISQYAMYPVDMNLSWQWGVYMTIQIALLGLVAGFLYKPKPID
jgi:hypothetical protein